MPIDKFLVALMFFVALGCAWVQHAVMRLVRASMETRMKAGDPFTRKERLADLSAPVGLAAIVILGIFGYWFPGPFWTIICVVLIHMGTDYVVNEYGSVWKGLMLEWDQKQEREAEEKIKGIP